MAVQGQGGLHAEGVPGPQAGGPGPQLHEPVPEVDGVGAVAVELIADGLAGVAGLGHPHGPALHGQGAQGVLHVLRRQLPAPGQGLQDVLGLGALDGDGGVPVGDVGDRHVELLRLLVQVGQVLVDVAGVDDQQVFALLKAVEVHVVDDAALLVGDQGVLGLVHIQGKHVAGEDVLQEPDVLRALDVQAAHVADVEDPAVAAAVQVLGHNAGGVLDGHFPSAEVHQSGPGGHMGVVELGAFELAHTSVSSLCCFLTGDNIRHICFYMKTEAQSFPKKLCASVTGLRDSPGGSVPKPPRPRVAPSACGHKAAIYRVSSRPGPFA